MKNKPTRHKEINTFKFQSFLERISNIDVDIFHRVGHENETDSEGTECYFYQSIERWNMLNLTESFISFKREIQPHNLVTLPQLILNKENVIQTLFKHLKLKNLLSLQPLLDLVVAIARDLRQDFYPYYNDCLGVLIDLLDTKNTEQLEWTFTCLAYLFKFLWRPLLKNVTEVFNKLLVLLSSSRPDYVHNFAAGSFAFLARKVKDWPVFLMHILKTVKSTKDGFEGCGKLFFEIIHGVNGQFHSCAHTVFPFLINALDNPKYPQKVLFEILSKTIGNILSNINPQKNQLLWDTLLQRLEVLLEDWKLLKDEKLANKLELMLRLVEQCIEYKTGKFLQNNVPIMKIICDVLETHNLPDDVLLTTTKIVILLLLSRNVNLTQEQVSGVTRKVLALPHQKVVLYFVDSVSNFAAFEALILPRFLSLCTKTNLNEETLSVLTHLILKKAPLVENGINLAKWSKYPVEFKNTLDLENRLLDKLNDSNVEGSCAALIILPHLKLTQIERTVTILTHKMSELLFKIENCTEDDPELEKEIFFLNNTTECLVHLNNLEYLCENFYKLTDSLASLVRGGNIHALNIIDLLVTVLKDRPQIINIVTLQKLTTNLARGFSSSHHEVRLVTAHLYTFFEDLPAFNLTHSSDPDVPKEKFRIFSICYAIESIDAHVHTYRDQLHNLDKLSFDKPQMIMCNQTDFKSIPLRYLCGTLYINFKLLWEPVTKIIETHAHGLDISVFWDVFGNELRRAVQNIGSSDEKALGTLETEWSFLNELYEKSRRPLSGSDFINYRLLLWKAMDLFPDIAEAKTRDVAELFLDFIENEYTTENSSAATKCNIKQNTSSEQETENKNETVKPRRGKAGHQFLQTALIVFSKVRSPKSMYRESELGNLYFDLLLHKKPEIQKFALDCIMTYKHKFLTPYKEHLYNLIDDDKFRQELATFHIGKESDNIQLEHRVDLVPFIIRIVFSKMTTKTGGKASGQLRRNLVLRFLAGCEENEMLTFIKMAFRYYSTYLNDDPEIMIADLNKTVTLENFIPPKRMQSSLNLLNVILDQFGGLMSNELLAYIVKMFLMLGGAVAIAFEQLASVHSGYRPILKSLKNSAVRVVERFFGQFDRYPWTNKEINTVFNVFVWPYLNKLSTEGIHSPTALLKLFHQWGCNPRYFPLLVKHEDDVEDRFVLPHVIQLLLNPKSRATVVNVIEEMIEKMLMLQADDEDLQLVIPVDNLLSIAKNILDRIKVDDKLNYGSCILLPYVPSILGKIKRKLETKNKNLNQKELVILSRISELVWTSDVSDDTLKLLLPLVWKRCSSFSTNEDVVMRLLITVTNLIRNVETPRSHLKRVTPLFGVMGYTSGRKILIEILKIFGTEPEIAMVEGLNAFDAKWVDQADFQRRHDTFKQVQNALDAQEIDLELGALLIHNCFYLLKNEKDLSLRENSSHCLKQLIPYLIARHPKQVDYLLNDTVLTLIRSGMKEQGDFRNDCILILGHLSRECAYSHVILHDLNVYTNKIDLEVDFFENITHLQLHRRARALLKFCSVTRDLTHRPNVRTLTQFVLPLATFYLCNDKYVSKNSVIDAAIECVGTVCRILPWHQYEAILKFYLTQLQKNVDHQKQLVRLTVAILDAFHYDLSKAQLVEEQIVYNLQETVNVLTDEEKKSSEKDAEENDEDGEEVSSEVDDLGEIPDVENEADSNEEEDAGTEMQKETRICEKIPVLCKSAATRITKNIQNVLLPQLHKALAELTHHDRSHKVNRKKLSFEREEEDLLRVPISLALVKLLQRLPKDILDANLPGIFMKLCTFLKSHLESVRRVTRETLQKIIQALGPDYLNVLLSEMLPLLNKGFQVHVLVFTVHAVINCLKTMYKPTDIDKILLTVLQLCQADLFGNLSEEKEVFKIAVKTSEAKSTKSFDTFQILAQYVTDKCLLDLILPIKNVLQTSHSFKTVHKAQECLRHVALGLVDNEFVGTHSLLIFAYGTASESIPEFVSREKPQLSEKEREKLERERLDCFIITKPSAGRSGFRAGNVKSSRKTNAHILIEFGLRLCYVMLKREKLKEEEFKPYLDPFVKVFRNCLTSKNVELSTLTLQCLTWILKHELPSLKDNIKDMTEEIFAILHKYASAGLSKGANFDLVVAAFKAVGALVRDVKYHTIDTKQLKILLFYAEQDMHDHDRQATAFSLLKAIVARRLYISEIHEVMTKVAELSVTSELDHVRSQARAVFYQYLMEYPLGDKLEKHLAFYLSQTSYEMQYGRESAIEMISTLISSFPLKTLSCHCGALFVSLGARLVNDEVPDCRKRVSDCLSSLLVRLEKKDKDDLFDIVILWLKDKNISHRKLAAQLCGIFVSVEKSSFESRLSKLLPLVLKQFKLLEREEDEDEETNRIKDHLLFQLLQMLIKICSHSTMFLEMKETEELSGLVQKLLGHPHDWVRLSAAQFLGFVLASIDVGDLAESITKGATGGRGYLRQDSVADVKSLILDLCDQLLPGIVNADLAEQVIKNLVFLARVLAKVPQDHKISLLWLTKRMRKIVNSEVVETPSSTILRTQLFKFIAAIVSVLDLETQTPIFSHLLAPLVREMITVEESNAPLRHLSKEVAALLKKRVGSETYMKTLSSLQQILSTKRAERKRSRTQLAVTDPETFAKKKLVRHEKKKAAKKRKLEQLKGKRNFKKRKTIALNPESEVM